MELKELTNLISIRQYVANSIALPTIDRLTVNMLSNMLLLLDEKIINILKGRDFQDYIDYKDIQEVKARAVEITTRVFSEVKGRK